MRFLGGSSVANRYFSHALTTGIDLFCGIVLGGDFFLNEQIVGYNEKKDAIHR